MGGLQDGVINSGFADEHAMQIVSLVWGILALLGVLAALTPFFGALNWLLIPFAVVGAVVSAIVTGMAPEGRSGKSIAGLICCGVAAILGLLRLIAGLGVL
ncbi:MAG TPA: hypothetical protein VFR79_08375 [Nitrospira sp.]|nr:hypothetical protein [Nitrospira sp.]